MQYYRVPSSMTQKSPRRTRQAFASKYLLRPQRTFLSKILTSNDNLKNS